MTGLTTTTVDSGEHVAVFFERDWEIVPEIVELAWQALGQGAAVMLILAEPRMPAFRDALRALGVDVEARCADGVLTFLDAADVIELITDGRVDQQRFDQLVRSAAVRFLGQRPVFVYGEAVSVLWEAGNVWGAIELERAWSRLLKELSLTLVCGYCNDATQSNGNHAALDQVCGLHSRVLHRSSGEPVAAERELSGSFDPDRTAARDARHLVARTLEGWGYGGGVLEDAQLIVTELATNAIIHAKSEFSVHVRLEHSRLWLSVQDLSPVMPVAQEPAPDAISGRGLRLVAALAHSWGAQLDGEGKSVWAVLSL